MKKSELLELLNNGENSRVEFKEERVKPDHLAKEILAFANSDGGTILMGVNDRGGVTGVTRKDMEEWIVNICRNNCHPSLIPIIEAVKLEEKTVVAALIRKREGMVHRSSDGHYYILSG